MIKLRYYQNNTVDYMELMLATRRHISPLIVAPTGGGKTIIFCEFIRRVVKQGLTYMVMANRQELIYQPQGKLLTLAKELEEPLLRPNVLMGGTPQYKNRGGWIASVQTLQRRELPHADIIIIDEAHLSASAKWEEMIKEYKERGAFVIGFTATPQRLDGKPLKILYDEIYQCGSVKNLTAEGFLVPVRYKYKAVNTSGLKMKGKDFDEADMYANIYKRGAIHDGIVDDYFEYAEGLKTLVFCCNIEHAQTLAQEFAAMGLVARSLTSKDSSVYRKELLQQFADSKIDILTNCGVLTTGYDCPSVQCVLLARATQSLVLYLQMIGRGTRPSANKDHLLVLDYGNNVASFGRIDIDRQWSLEGIKKKMVNASKLCPAIVDDIPCMQVCEMDATVCDVCGHVFDNTIVGLSEMDKLMGLGKKREVKIIKGGEMIEEDDPLYKELMAAKLSQVPTELLAAAVQIKGFKKGAEYMERKRRNELTPREIFLDLAKRYSETHKVEKNMAIVHLYKMCNQKLRVNLWAIRGVGKSVLARIEESDLRDATNYLPQMNEYIKNELL